VTFIGRIWVTAEANLVVTSNAQRSQNGQT